jgi:hypothetical protein
MKLTKNDFKDFDMKDIMAKKKQIADYEAKYGSNSVTKAWTNWCNDYAYRKNEWWFRQNVANSINPTTNYLKPYYNDIH